MNPTNFMFNAIKSQFPWANCSLPSPADISTELVFDAYRLAVAQDMGHLVAFATENFVDAALQKEFKKQKMLALFRREQINLEEKRIFELFDENGIDYIPLKGSVIKNFYPEEWMRTSSDSDILIRPEDDEKAIALLTNNLGYTYEGKSAKDFQLFSSNGVHIELHYSSKNGIEKCDRVLSQIWDYAYKIDDDSGKHQLSPEFLLFYTVAHALYHFLGGGCGVKPILDIWVLESQMKYNVDKFHKLIGESQSEAFYNGLKALSEVWFGNGVHTELTKSMEDYILEGGTYGTRENFGKAALHKNGGRLKYLFARIFKPKKYLELQYPNLKNHPVLLPYYQIKRWFNLLDNNRRKDVSLELQGSIKSHEAENLFNILEI